MFSAGAIITIKVMTGEEITGEDNNSDIITLFQCIVSKEKSLIRAGYDNIICRIKGNFYINEIE